MQAKAIYLDAGHGLSPSGGTDNGAVGSGTSERDQVVALCQALLPLLAHLPLEVVPIGITERLSLPQKIKQINDLCATRGWASGDALLLSVHMNADATGTARGVEGWYSSQKPAQVGLAQTMAQNVARASGLPLRDPSAKPSAQDRLGHLGILDDTVPTAVLVECGFVTSVADVKVVAQHASVAQGLYQGLVDYLQLPPSSMDTYADVPADAWYRDAVYYGQKEGIFDMPPDHLFHPDRPATRAELAVMFARLLRKVP
jgi:N-acetylmuramoyl-L-alanine amidase